MGIAKQAITETTNTPVNTTVSTPLSQAPFEFEGIPVDYYRILNIEMGNLAPKELQKIKDIYAWSRDGTDGIGDALMKVRKLESTLGAPALNERRYDKIWRWIKLQNSINDLTKRQSAMGARQWV